MDIDKFKQQIKQVCDNNPHAIKFSIIYADKSTDRQEFETKKAFGARLVEIFESYDLENIDLYFFNRKGFRGYAADLADVVNEKDVEKMTFLVLTKEDIRQRTEAEKRMTAAEWFYYKK